MESLTFCAKRHNFSSFSTPRVFSTPSPIYLRTSWPALARDDTASASRVLVTEHHSHANFRAYT